MRLSPIAAIALQVAFAAAPTALHAQDRFRSVAPRMQEFVDKGEVAGVVTLVATKDRILHLGAAGKSDLASGRKMRPDDIFWIASMSKPVTAVAVAILADEGKLRFDDPVAKHLPEFAGRTMTLRDIFTHTSGLGELEPRDPHWTLAEFSAKFAQQPLRFQPGARWAYSTAGIDVLGRVVEVVSGIPFDAFLQKRVFDPLGMKDTSFWIAPARNRVGRTAIAGTPRLRSSRRPRSATCMARRSPTATARHWAGQASSRRRKTWPASTR